MFYATMCSGCGQDLVLFQKRKLGKEAVQAQALSGRSDVAFVIFVQISCCKMVQVTDNIEISHDLYVMLACLLICRQLVHDVECTLILLGQVS